MFTTDTPAAQLLSMPRSAAIPPKLAPYPTLVGTAMTGTCTRPAMTLGSAPNRQCGAAAVEGLGDRGDLGGGLAYPHADLRDAWGARARMIDAGKPESLEGPAPHRREQAGLSGGGIALAPRSRLDQGLEL